MQNTSSWRFTDSQGSFALDNPDAYSHLYFPLANSAGMMSSVTPVLGGDAKTGQSTFLLEPVSTEDLHASRSTRNFWVYKEGAGAWSAAGSSAKQLTLRGTGQESSRLEAGFLWHSLTRENLLLGLKSEITTFVPCEDDTVELTKVVITNTSGRDAVITATAAVPVYGRSADNVRDHRHVTSLLHRIAVEPYGITVTPTLLFDEHGHSINYTRYAVLGAEGEGGAPTGFFPDVERFIGEGGTFDWPQAAVSNLPPCAAAGDRVEGYEAMGGLRFATLRLAPGEQAAYILALCINTQDVQQKYLTAAQFDRCLDQNKAWWAAKLNVKFSTADPDFDNWMRWVSCEPVLRRIYGCSFLPDHDYGRGGRGWRDLWQDCIALLIMEPGNVGRLLYSNCAGIRFDGTNATIIGAGEGEFIADRNNIARVWMDHGAWPLNTIAFYINQTGDLDFLLKEQTYFKDRQSRRGRSTDRKWSETDGTCLMTAGGKPYTGTIAEHLLIENLTACLNVGGHGMLRLENADWNDALDMAAQNGESVAFTSMYCGNLRALAALLSQLKASKGITGLMLARELALLLDSVESERNVTSEDKQKLLSEYCACCEHEVSGVRLSYDIDKLIGSLERKADSLAKRIADNERVTSSEGYTWFNSYYDNHGRPVDGETDGQVRMMLTGQVFAVMFGVADDDLTAEIARAADRYLFDEANGGYRLNTNFHELKTDLGRQFGFAYGHKENGAVFSHMAVMYANALYKRGFVNEGCKALDALCRHSMDFASSVTYPGIPEYFNTRGRGMYPYLTGAASWLTLTCVTEVFGIRGRYGDLVFEPKLLSRQFDANGEAACETLFGGRQFIVVYQNAGGADYGEYAVTNILLDGEAVAGAKLDAGLIASLEKGKPHTVQITLGRQTA